MMFLDTISYISTGLRNAVGFAQKVINAYMLRFMCHPVILI